MRYFLMHAEYTTFSAVFSSQHQCFMHLHANARMMMIKMMIKMMMKMKMMMRRECTSIASLREVPTALRREKESGLK